MHLTKQDRQNANWLKGNEMKLRMETTNAKLCVLKFIFVLFALDVNFLPQRKYRG